MRTMILVAAAGVLLAAPVGAQSHQHGATGAGAAKQHECPMHQNGAAHGTEHAQGAHTAHGGSAGQPAMSMHAAGAAHRYMPKMIVQHAEMLKLTPEQVTELERIQAAHQADCQQRMADIRKADEAAAALLEQSALDLSQYEARLREAAELKVKCRVGMVAAAQQAKALLTPEQLGHMAHMSHGGH